MLDTKKKIFNLRSQCEQLMLNAAPDKPVIAVCGLMNAGKSYLLNMLTQNIETEYFKTADQRETSCNKTLKTEQYIYLDTPGLDANTQDDAIAQQGISSADIVLFVHQPQGELELNEMAFIRQLKTNFGDSAKNSIVIVISKIDKESQSKIDEIDKAIQKQCQEHLNINLTTIQISNTRYKNGVSQHKDGLINASHIRNLMEHLKKISPEIYQVRHNKRTSSIRKMLGQIEILMQELHDEKTTIQKNVAEQFADFNSQINQLQDFLTESTSNFNKI